RRPPRAGSRPALGDELTRGRPHPRTCRTSGMAGVHTPPPDAGPPPRPPRDRVARHADARNDAGPGRPRHGALSGSAVAVSALGGTRTPNLLIRSQMLSPIELRAPVAEEQAYRGRRRAPNRHLPPGRPPRRPDAPSPAWLAWPATTAAAEGGWPCRTTAPGTSCTTPTPTSWRRRAGCATTPTRRSATASRC